MSLPFRVEWVWGGPDGSSSLHGIFFPMFFKRSTSLPFRVGVWVWGGGDDVDVVDDDDDDQRCASALRLRANDGMEP